MSNTDGVFQREFSSKVLTEQNAEVSHLKMTDLSCSVSMTNVARSAPISTTYRIGDRVYICRVRMEAKLYRCLILRAWSIHLSWK